MRNVNLIPFNFSIQNKTKSSVDIHIDGNIVDAQTQALMREWWGDTTSVSFRSFREALDKEDVKEYNIYINSNGGHVGDAMAMHDLLIDMQSKGKIINTFGRGIVASAATYILMAGNSEMSENSWFMIHNVSGMVYGDVNEIENYAVTLRKFNNSARDFYSTKTGKRKEEITKLMNAESWFTGNEAKENNFVKAVSKTTNFSNTISADKWQFTDINVLQAYNNFAGKPPAATTEIQEIKTEIQDMKKTFLQEILNAIKGVKPADEKPETIVNSLVAVLQPLIEATPDEEPIDVTDIVNAAVTKATDPLTARLNTLEADNKTLTTKNAALITQIENHIGKPSSSVDKNEVDKKPVGSFGRKAVYKD